MTKKKSSLPNPPVVPTVETRPFGQMFLIKKDNTLTPEPGIPEDKVALLATISQEELNTIIYVNRTVIFGEQTVGMTAKIGDVNFPFDAFLFDFSNREEPQCFLLMTAKGVTTSMLALIAIRSYLYAIENKVMLMEMLSEHIRKDKASQKIFKKFIVDGSTIEAMLRFVIGKRLRALFLTGEDDPESVKLFASYVGAHSEILDIIEIRKYKVGKINMLSVLPSFSDLKEKHEVKVKVKVPKEKIIHTEEHHFQKSSASVLMIYEKLKAEMIKIDKSIVFNTKGKHYISMKKTTSRNLAFFHFKKASLYLVVMLEEKLVKKIVKHHEIKTLPESVQKFWNGKSTGLVISNSDYLKEISEVLKKLIKSNWLAGRVGQESHYHDATLFYFWVVDAVDYGKINFGN